MEACICAVDCPCSRGGIVDVVYVDDVVDDARETVQGVHSASARLRQ